MVRSPIPAVGFLYLDTKILRARQSPTNLSTQLMMAHFILGLATGTLISGLITKYYEKGTSWINPAYIFVLSGALYLLFIWIN